MILIFTSNEDQSTLAVKKWLDCFQKEVMLISPGILAEKINLYIDLQSDFLQIDGRKIHLSEIKCLWFRKWSIDNELKVKTSSNIVENFKIKTWLKEELNELSMFLFSFFKSENWLCFPAAARTNKLIQQREANQIGLATPNTFITTKWTKSYDSNYITKSIENNIMIGLDDELYANYTEDCNSFNDSFPSLVQEKINKEYEIRVFFLNGKCYSMAIFSQSDEQTKNDFRRYNLTNPNRTIPYQLDTLSEEKIVKLMRKLELNTGSLDFIRCKDSQKLFFLEVNPQGQFGMVSNPCNYYLEKKIANELINISNGTN